MAATSFRTIVNYALVALGEDELDSGATALTSKYEKLVGAFVNQIKEEIEDATQWRVLRSTVPVTITAGQSSGTITGANERTRLYRAQQSEYDQPYPLVFDVTDAAQPVPLTEVDLPTLLAMLAEVPASAVGPPGYFALDHSGADALTLRVFPVMSDTRTINVTLIIPQTRLDPTTLTTNILIPRAPLEVGVIWALREERGEELGPDSAFSQQRYQMALQSAVARDQAESGGMDLVVV